MPELSPTFLAQCALLIAGGAVAGFVNSLAGGGSFLTVPLLFSLGLPISVANATNRVGVFVQCLTALLGFRQEGVRTLSSALRVVPVVLIGSFVGAWLSTSLPDRLFQRIFGVLMLGMLPVILLNPKPSKAAASEEPDPADLGMTPAGVTGTGERSAESDPKTLAPVRPPRPWTRQALEQGAFLALGVYGGAIQAGIGIPLLLLLVGVGKFDLVRANSVKVALVAALTGVALAEFVYAGKVNWTFGIILAVGTGIGGYAGGRLGARVGERLIRPIMAVAVVGFALQLLFA